MLKVADKSSQPNANRQFLRVNKHRLTNLFNRQFTTLSELMRHVREVYGIPFILHTSDGWIPDAVISMIEKAIELGDTEILNYRYFTSEFLGFLNGKNIRTIGNEFGLQTKTLYSNIVLMNFERESLYSYYREKLEPVIFSEGGRVILDRSGSNFSAETSIKNLPTILGLVQFPLAFNGIVYYDFNSFYKTNPFSTSVFVIEYNKTKDASHSLHHAVSFRYSVDKADNELPFVTEEGIVISAFNQLENLLPSISKRELRTLSFTSSYSEIYKEHGLTFRDYLKRPLQSKETLDSMFPVLNAYNGEEYVTFNDMMRSLMNPSFKELRRMVVRDGLQKALKSLTEQREVKKGLNLNGKQYSKTEISELFGINYTTLSMKLGDNPNYVRESFAKSFTLKGVKIYTEVQLEKALKVNRNTAKYIYSKIDKSMDSERRARVVKQYFSLLQHCRQVEKKFNRYRSGTITVEDFMKSYSLTRKELVTYIKSGELFTHVSKVRSEKLKSKLKYFKS